MSPERNGEHQNIDPNHKEEDEDPIQEKIAKIIQVCKEQDALFGDSEFPATD